MASFTSPSSTSSPPPPPPPPPPQPQTSQSPTASSPSYPLADLPADTTSSDPAVDSEISSSLIRRSQGLSSFLHRRHRENEVPGPPVKDETQVSVEEDVEVNQESEVQQREWEDAETKGGGTIELRIRRSGTETPERNGKKGYGIPQFWKRKGDKVEGVGVGVGAGQTTGEEQYGNAEASTSTQRLASPPSSSQALATAQGQTQAVAPPAITSTSPPSPTTQTLLPTTKSVNLTSSSPTEVAEAKREMKKQIAKVKEEYVWDVLFENQRGILFFGISHFSSSTLFPFDPPAYTVPTHTPRASPVYPTTQDAAKCDPPKHQVIDTGSVLPNDGEKGGKKKGKSQKQSIKTPFTPQTYQLPSSDWIWLTPWLINMRQDGLTDERGWEYNYFFRSGSGSDNNKKSKKKGSGGWVCEVGKLGWGGWVRRRMWVRLRMLVVPSVEEDEENRADDGQLEATPTTPISEDGFDDGKLVLPDEKNELDVRVIVKAMAEHPLDRQRLDMWRNWFVDSAEKGKKNTTKATKEDVMVQLKRVLDDEDNVGQIMSAVTYNSSRRSLLNLWKEHGIEVEAKT